MSLSKLHGCLNKYFITLSCWITVAVSLAVTSACSKDENDDEPTLSRAVLVYIVAENSLKDFVQADINEMLTAKAQLGKNDRLVVYVDDTSYPRIYEITNKTSAVSYTSLQPKFTYSNEMDSASPETFSDVLSYFFSNYKTDSYGLVMWSHGSGWINDPQNSSEESAQIRHRKTFGVDNGHNSTSNSGSRMEIKDMASVLSNFPKLEFILFDACFMQTMEVAYELRNTAKYIIGSPAETPAQGAPYQNVVATMFATSFSPQAMAYNYYAYYGTGPYGVVISAIKTEAFPAYVYVMSDLFARYEFLDDSLYSDCLDYYLYQWNSLSYSDAINYPDYYDVQAIMLKVLSSADYVQWKTAFDSLVPYKYASSGWYSAYNRDTMEVIQDQCGGVSMYLPLEKYKSQPFYQYYYKTAWGSQFDIK